jgi:O-antigen ligase
MFLTKYVNTIKAEPLTFSMGAGVLMLAVMGTSVRHVSSAVFAILFLMSLVVIKDWFKVFASLSRLEKLFLAAFFLYTLSGLLSFYNVDDVDKYYRLLERFLRFSLIVPVYLLLIRNGKSILNYLYAGSIISGPFLAAIAINHYIEHPDVPAQGYYHHIIFGQLAMLNVGIMLSLLLSRNMQRKYQLLIIASMLCGIVTAVMSQARGVWLVFPAYVLIATYYVVKDKRLSARTLVSILISVVLLALLTPVGELIKNRTDAAVTEISRFYSEDQYVSSVGTRLAMWDIAINVWQENPLLGTGPGDFDDEIQTLQKRGEYVGMAVHNSVHNIYIQALVGSGIVGLIAMLLAVIVMPTIVLLNRHVTDREGRLAGIITVVSFAIYGFSESWTLRLSAISIFLVFLVVIVSHLSIVRSQKKQ